MYRNTVHVQKTISITEWYAASIGKSQVVVAFR
jgi:hypothetical protein